jgi:Fe-S-cluster containining protein
MTDEIHRRVLEVYADVDAAVAAAGPKCDASGRCCRFKEWGHVLYLSALEAEVLLAGAPPFEKPVSPDFCPFQKENLCTAREPRPLGCRIYFCDSAYQETGNAIMEDALRRLKQLTKNASRSWRYAPLHVFLNEASFPPLPQRERGDLGEGMKEHPDQRVPLPLTNG